VCYNSIYIKGENKMKISRVISHRWHVTLNQKPVGEVRGTTKTVALKRARSKYGENVSIRKIK